MPTTPDALNQVDVLAVDSTEGYQKNINPITDAIRTAAVFFQEPGNIDLAVSIWRDGGDLRFRDVNNTGTSGEGVSLSDLLSGGVGDAPFSFFNAINESYELEYTRVDGLITGLLAHVPGDNAQKIREVDNISISGDGLVSGMRIRQYAANRTSVLETFTLAGNVWIRT